MLEVQEIHKSYEGAPLLRGVSFRVDRGESVCLLGPSGSGKSTMLRIIAGLELPEAGRVIWEGQDLAGVPPHRRGFGLMFQDYALFPHRNVAENVAFGLRMQALPASEIRLRTEEALRRVNLLLLARRSVTDLSGGEQQRVALARALAPRPRLLMLDEPLGSLDRSLRDQLLEDLRRILRAAETPSIYVTHDQEEAFAVADRLILIREGQVEQEGTPAEVFARPGSGWVARFLALGNVVEATIASLDPLVVENSLGRFQPTCAHAGHRPGSRIALLLRPSPSHAPNPAAPPLNLVEGVVEDSAFRGTGFRIRLRCAHGHRVNLDTPVSYPAGTRVRLALEPEAVQCLG